MTAKLSQKRRFEKGVFNLTHSSPKKCQISSHIYISIQNRSKPTLSLVKSNVKKGAKIVPALHTSIFWVPLYEADSIFGQTQMV